MAVDITLEPGIRVEFVGPGCWMWFAGGRDGVAATRGDALDAARSASREEEAK